MVETNTVFPQRPRRIPVLGRCVAGVVVALCMLLTLVAAPRWSEAETVADPAPVTDFTIGWYDTLAASANAASIARQGMSTVTGYWSGAPLKYLDAAKNVGLQVMVEIPRTFVKNVNVEGVKWIVRSYKSHPAIRGWYLADEPSTNTALGPLSAANARTLYEAIKAEDPERPVAIAFGSSEDPRPYLTALDVLMHDQYPFKASTPEFGNLGNWTNRTAGMASIARNNNKDFQPIVQGFGGTPSSPVLGYRAPSAAELRYMVYTALQTGPAALYFWSFYRSDPAWISSVLMPLVEELQPLRWAIGAGLVPDVVATYRIDVKATAFQHPATGEWYIVTAHRSGGTVNGTVKLSGPLATKTSATLMADPSVTVPITNGNLLQMIGPYEIKVYRIE